MSEHAPHQGGGYERSDATLRPIVVFTVALVVLTIVVVFAMRSLFRALDESAAAADAPLHPMAQEVRPPAPNLQADPAAELAAQRAREHELVSGYAWIDREKGIVRIPLERALELTAQRGLPARK